jgi:hypothetical protein
MDQITPPNYHRDSSTHRSHLGSCWQLKAMKWNRQMYLLYALKQHITFGKTFDNNALLALASTDSTETGWFSAFNTAAITTCSAHHSAI